MALLALLLRLDHHLALLPRELAEAPVLAPLPGTPRQHADRFETEADVFRNREPGDAGEETESDRGERDEDEGCAGVAQRDRQAAARRVADDPAGGERQLGREGMQPHRLQRRGRKDEDRKTGEREAERLGLDVAIPPDHGSSTQRHPPVRRESEEIEEEVRYVGAGQAAGIARRRVGRAVRPARVVTAVGQENEKQIKRQHPKEEPLCLAEESREPCWKGRRAALL